MQMKKTVLFLISVLFFGALRAQESPYTDTLGVKVYFRQGYSLLEPSYRDNGVRLAAFAAHVESLQRDTLVRVKSIRVTGTASPDGTSRSNERLSENRAKNIIISGSLFRRACRGHRLGRTDGLGRNLGDALPRRGAEHSVQYARMDYPRRQGR